MTVAKYYDAIYADKDYAAETRYVRNLLPPVVHTMLDLGCGTGRHGEEFDKIGIKVEGVDSDPEMIEIAANRINCTRGDVTTYRDGTYYDAVVALFHVASYMTLNSDFTALADTAYDHLRREGRFVFDFWYGPAVLTDRPEPRRKYIGSLNQYRFSRPTMRPNDNCVDVEHELMGEKQTTSMRYWFLPELRYSLWHGGFVMERAERWMGGELGFDSWYGCIVARKV